MLLFPFCFRLAKTESKITCDIKKKKFSILSPLPPPFPQFFGSKGHFESRGELGLPKEHRLSKVARPRLILTSDTLGPNYPDRLGKVHRGPEGPLARAREGHGVVGVERPLNSLLERSGIYLDRHM